MYYDCHSHLDDINRYGGWSAEELLEKMDSSGIERAEIRTPMALTVIAGLISATVLTLVVIPTVYDLMDWRK